MRRLLCRLRGHDWRVLSWDAAAIWCPRCDSSRRFV